MNENNRIDSGGGHMIGVVVGGSDVRMRVENVRLDHRGDQAPKPTLEEMVARLAELQPLLAQAAALPGELRGDARTNVELALEALRRRPPNLRRARQLLQAMLEEVEAEAPDPDRGEMISNILAIAKSVAVGLLE
jgi:hypothetical protein